MNNPPEDYCDTCEEQICNRCALRDSLLGVALKYEKAHREWEVTRKGLEKENEQLKSIISEYRQELERRPLK